MAEVAERQLHEVEVRPRIGAAAVRHRRPETAQLGEGERRVPRGRDLLDVVRDAVVVVVVQRRRVAAAVDPVDDDALAGERELGGPVGKVAAVRRPPLDPGARAGRTREKNQEDGAENAAERCAYTHVTTTPQRMSEVRNRPRRT